MKKLNFLLMLAAVLFLSAAASAQKVFSEGKITYSIKVDLPPDAQQMASMFEDSRFELTFKNYMARNDMHLGPYHYTTIGNSRDSTAVSLIEAGGNKYLVRLNQEDMAEITARYKGVTFRDAGGTKNIAGYECRKAIGTLKDGNTFMVYYTTALMPDNTAYNRQFTGLKGLPLEYEMTTSNGLKMVLTATDVQLVPVPASVFDIPTSGYREVTRDELKSMLGRG